MKKFVAVYLVVTAVAIVAYCSLINRQEPVSVPQVVEQTQERVEELREKVEERIEQKVEQVEEKVEKAEEKVEQKIEETVEHVEELKEEVRELTFEEVLDNQAALHLLIFGEQLDWRHSVVDALKLWDFPSSFEDRKTLAWEYGYKHSYTGSAKNNVWLHTHYLHWLKGD